MDTISCVNSGELLRPQLTRLFKYRSLLHLTIQIGLRAVSGIME
nr:MAG TPA: hypothetical protein [Caudoviricetes sp.]